MAVDVICSSESSSPSVISPPRISFSHDLKEPIEESLILDQTNDNNPTIDFDFCVDQGFFSHGQISSADELFSNGRILPVQIKKALKPPQTHGSGGTAETGHQDPKEVRPEHAKENPKKKRLMEFLSDEQKPTAKHFWQFRRSTSANSGNNNVNSNNNFGLLRTLNFLKRSNSTGSAPNPKPYSLPGKTIKKQHSLKEGPVNYRVSSTMGSYQYTYCPNHGDNIGSKRPSLRKSMSSSNNNRSYRSNSNGVGIISPVLNINPSYIAKGTASLLGIGSFFCSKKSKKKKMKKSSY